jgi:signal peptide peptidase SppA
MKYAHILTYVARTLWAIAPDKWRELLAALAFRAAGHEFTPEEIRARIGDGGGENPGPSTQGAVAVIPIRGVLANRMSGMEESSGGASAERIGAVLAQVAADPNIKTIVYDIDSPGGTVPGIQELAAQMFALRGVKRQVAHVNDLAASAAYWLASQADEIVSVPSGTVGSIGVFAAHEDLSAALEKEGIKVTLISAGTFKMAGNPFEPLSEDERAVVQARVDDAYGQFVKDVARGRGVTPAAVRHGYGEGRALGATDAKAAGLIDRIDTLDNVLARLTARPSRASAGGMRGEDDAPAIGATADPVTPKPIASTADDDTRARRLRVL